jgi:hypothetical protein
VEKFEPLSGRGEIDHAEEAAGQLIVPGGNGAVDLEVAGRPHAAAKSDGCVGSYASASSVGFFSIVCRCDGTPFEATGQLFLPYQPFVQRPTAVPSS